MEWVVINKKWKSSFKEPYPKSPNTSKKELEKWGITLNDLVGQNAKDPRVEQMYEWRDSLPAVKKHYKKCEEWANKQAEFVANDFQDSGWCRAGVQIEVRHRDNVEILLIGDINVGGGVCDCCEHLDEDDVILRARDIWRDIND